MFRTKMSNKKIALRVLYMTLGFIIAFSISVPLRVSPMFKRDWNTQYRDSIGFGIESEQITLLTDDSIALAAWRTRVENPKGTVIIVSGLHRPTVTLFFGYAKMFADNGWDSLLIEKRARNLSEGDKYGFSMTDWIDVKAGVDFLTSDETVNDLLIVAMGTQYADTVIVAAGELDRIDAVIAVSSPSSYSDLITYELENIGIPRILRAVSSPFVKLFMGFHFGFKTLNYIPINGIAKLGGRPILLMHSTEDTIVPFEQYEKLLKKAIENDINVTPFVREGLHFYVCYLEHIYEPVNDVEFSQTILDFLDSTFPPHSWGGQGGDKFYLATP